MNPTPEMINAAAKSLEANWDMHDDDGYETLARLALTAALAVMWQDISTAPKNRHIIAGHVEHRWIRFARWYDVMWYYSGTNERSQYAQVRGDDPTHWMPLPAPPKETA